MARVETVNAQGSNSSVLSPEAAVFVPRHFPCDGDIVVPIQEIPTYMTNCYPFVTGELMGRPRGPWTRNARPQRPNFSSGRMSRPFSGHHPGCNRMPGPHKFSVEPPFPLSSPPPPPPPWSPVIPFNIVTGGIPGYQSPLNGMPFDGGTSPSDGNDNLNKNSEFKDENVKRKHNSGDSGKIDWQPVKDKSNGKRSRDKQKSGQRRRNDSGNKVNVAIQNSPSKIEIPDPAIISMKTVLYLDIAVQTDFPERIANLTLIQFSSPLYVNTNNSINNRKNFKVSDSNDSELDSDSGYHSPLHKRNQVSNGTQSVCPIESMTFTSSTRKHGPPRESGSFGSQPRESGSFGIKPRESGSFGTQPRESGSFGPQSGKSESFGSQSRESGSFGAQPMHSGSIGTNPSESGSAGMLPRMSYASVAQKMPSQNNVAKNNPTASTCDNRSNINPSSAIERVKNENKVQRTLETSQKNKNETVESAEGEVKKKRKRNRKRKKKKDGREGVSEMDVGEVTTKEVELHFEDDEEFPDLMCGIPKKIDYTRQMSPLRTRDENVDITYHPVKRTEEDSLNHHINEQFNRNNHVQSTQMSNSAPMTYSSILQAKKAVPVQRDIPVHPPDKAKVAWGKTQNEQNVHKDSAEHSATKAAKKRRKRREMVNKAADEELAEINLEQQVLKAEHLKTKQSKVVSKDTNTQQPGILKVNPQQQSGGKKSKQLVALDLGAMINALEKKKDTSADKKEHTRVTISATTSVVQQKTPQTKDDSSKKEEKLERKNKGSRPHNILDSSAPVLKRGKEREHPKPKKPSPLKKVILKEREEKKQLRLLDDPEAENDGAPVGIGVINAESDLSQDALSSKGSMDFGAGTPASADLSPISQTSPISMSPLSPGPSPQSSEVNSPIAGVVGKDVIRKIHSRRFREYCNQVLDKDIDNCCVALLQDLVRFQDRMYHKDPAKAKTKRRFVLGLREVTKHLKLRKIKCVIISPNLEKIQSKGGLDDALNNILNLVNEQDIPFVFALGRRALGRACAKLVPVSVVGIFNYDGTEENFRKLMSLTEKARDSYKDMVALVEKEVREYPIKKAANVPHIFAHMGHSRTPSGASVLSFTSSILSEPISENYPHSEPETDSKGYEIIKDLENFNFSSNISNVLPSNPKPYHFKIPYKHNVGEIDDGNEADTEEYGEMRKQVRGSSSEEGEYSESFQDSLSQTGSDTVEELPHIESIHSSSHDLCAEIMSQTSGRTIENCEAMSTNSSRTLGDGSSTILADPGDRSKHDTPKSTESPGSTLQRGKVIDEERIKSWVDETQSRLENLQLETSTDCSTDNDSDSESSTDDENDNCYHGNDESCNHDDQESNSIVVNGDESKDTSVDMSVSNVDDQNCTEQNGCHITDLPQIVVVEADNIENELPVDGNENDEES